MDAVTDYTEIRQCEICDASAPYWAVIASYRHYRCGRCGHLFVFPRPSQAELDAFYQPGDYYDLAGAQEARLVAEARSRIALLGALAGRWGLERRVLDVGCASGLFLTAAREAGWDAFGIDRSENIVERARSRAGVTVFNGIFEQSGVPGGPYPIVSAWEVLEHAVDVRSFFLSLVRAVAPGGLLALSTPLGSGLPARILGVRYPMLTPPEHLSIFSRRSLRILAEENGLQQVDYRSFSNLGIESLASGLARILFGKPARELTLLGRTATRVLAWTCAGLPYLMDAGGVGTEMQVVFRRRAA